MQIITCASPKGGPGKTTTALLLAVYAMQKPRKLRVALMDFNADQENIDQWFTDRSEKLPRPQQVAVTARLQELRGLAEHYDLLVVDTPPVIDDTAIVEAAVAIASFVVVPVRPSVLDLGAMPAIVRLCQQRKKKFAFLLCDVTKAWDLATSATKGLRKIGGDVMDASLSHRKAYVDAMTIGRTGAEVDSECRKETGALWDEIQERMGAGHGR